MSQSARILLCFAGLSLFVATGLGAYASHGAESALDAHSLQSLRTAIEYQFYNSLGLLAVGLLVQNRASAALMRMAGYLILAGIVLFCGPIYARTFGAPVVIGFVSPVGGTALMLGWLGFAAAVWRGQADSQD